MKAQQVSRDLPAKTDDFVQLAPELTPELAPLTPQQILLVPGQAVPVLRLSLPAALRGQVREQVARRQLQDLTGLAPEVLEMRPFVVSGKKHRTASGWQAVLVAERADVAQWRQRAGRARAVLPDYLALPAALDLWVLDWAEETAAEEADTRLPRGCLRARLGLRDGFSAEAALAEQLLQHALQARPDTGPEDGAEAWPKAVYCTTPIADLPAAIVELLRAADLPLYDQPQALAAVGLEPPQLLAHGELALDLRRDPYLARTRLRRGLRAALAPVLAAALAGALWASNTVLETRTLVVQTQALEQAMLAELRAGLLPQGPIFDIRRQVSQVLANQRSATEAQTTGGAPLALLAAAAEVIAAAGAEVEQIRYDQAPPGQTGQGGRAGQGAQAGQLTARLRLADFAAAEALQAALRQAGFPLRDAQSRSAEQGGVLLELQIQHREGGQRDG